MSRLKQLQVENRTLAARSAAMNGSCRSAVPSAAVADADAGRLYSVVEALLACNQAMQDRHQSGLQTLQESLISNQRSLQKALVASQLHAASIQEALVASQRLAASIQEALVASQRHGASAQTHSVALIVAAGCLGAALLAVAVVRGRA
jgi:hypothetical protein